MIEQCDKLLKVAMQFRKIKISSIIPLKHSEYATLHTIRTIYEEYDDGKKQKVKVSDITDVMKLNSTAVSRTLKSLEESGYIERTVNKDDRRVTYVDITASGNEILDKSKEILDDYAESVFKKMGTEDMEQLCDYLNRLYEASYQELNKRRKAKGKGE